MLLTRSPLTTQQKPCDPFDLHVLSTPPAFVLSQDQTLHRKPMKHPDQHQPHNRAGNQSSQRNITHNHNSHERRGTQTNKCYVQKYRPTTTKDGKPTGIDLSTLLSSQTSITAMRPFVWGHRAALVLLYRGPPRRVKSGGSPRTCRGSQWTCCAERGSRWAVGHP